MFADIGYILWVDHVSDMAAAKNTSAGTGGGLRFAPLYSVDEYICRSSGYQNARLSSILPRGVDGDGINCSG